MLPASPQIRWVLCLAALGALGACGSSSDNGAASLGAGTAGMASAGTPAAGSAAGGVGGTMAGAGGSMALSGAAAGLGGAGGGAGGAGTGGDAAGMGGVSGGGGSPSQPFILPAFTAMAAAVSTNTDTRNAGHEFKVASGGVVVRDLGVYDAGADGLKAQHTVTLFSLVGVGVGATATPVEGGSVEVPAGTVAELESGYRYAPLAAPVTLKAGTYAVVAYGLNAGDLPANGGGLPVPATGVTSAGFDPYEFVTTPSPAFPNGGDNNAHANASFRYESKLKPLRIMPYGASITDGFLGTHAGYRSTLGQLLDDVGVVHQFIGSSVDNPGNPAMPIEQQHHEGHPGYVVISGTSGRDGIWDHRNEWLGPTGSQADVFLIVIGSNDVSLDYQLATAGDRLDQLLTAIHELQPKAHVVLAQLPPIKDDAMDAKCVTYNQAVVAQVDAHAKKGEPVTTVDFHSALTKADLNDNLHPTDAGYAKMAKLWFDHLQTLKF